MSTPAEAALPSEFEASKALSGPLNVRYAPDPALPPSPSRLTRASSRILNKEHAEVNTQIPSAPGSNAPPPLTSESSATSVSVPAAAGPTAGRMDSLITIARLIGMEIPNDPNVGTTAVRLGRLTSNSLILAEAVHNVRNSLSISSVGHAQVGIPPGGHVSEFEARVEAVEAWLCPEQSNSLSELIQSQVRREVREVLRSASRYRDDLSELRNAICQEVITHLSLDIGATVAQEVARAVDKRSGDAMSVDSVDPAPVGKKRQLSKAITYRASTPDLSFARRSQSAIPPVPSLPPVPRDTAIPGPPPLPFQKPRQNRMNDSVIVLGPSTWHSDEVQLRQYVRKSFEGFQVVHLLEKGWKVHTKNGFLSVRLFNSPNGAGEFVAAYYSRQRAPGWESINASAELEVSVYFRVTILSLNINGHLILKLADPSTWELFEKADVILIQETHLWPNQHATIRLPPGWLITSYARPVTDHTVKQFGGICIIHRSSLPVIIMEGLSTCDVLVASLFNCIIVNVYIPPEGSPWLLAAPKPPEDHLYETLEALQVDSESETPMVVLGDFNARTGTIQPSKLGDPRCSADGDVNSRGRRLVEILRSLDCSIVNGSCLLRDPSKSSGFTSFQPNGQAVVDYALANPLAWRVIQSFDIHHKAELSDHASLLLHLELVDNAVKLDRDLAPEFGKRMFLRQSSPSPHFPSLDRLLRSTIEDIPSSKQALLELYGPAEVHSPPVIGAIAIASDSAHQTESLNSSFHYAIVWESDTLPTYAGSLDDAATAHTAAVCALVMAIRALPGSASAVLKSSAESVLESLSSRAPMLQQIGWKCASSEFLLAGVHTIRARRAPIRLVHASSSDELLQRAKSLARSLVSSSRRRPGFTFSSLIPPDWAWFRGRVPQKATNTPLGSRCKISWTLRSPNPDESQSESGPTPGSVSHRHRFGVRQTALENRLALESARNDREWWNISNEITEDKPCRTFKFSIQDLSHVFAERMTMPVIPHPSFNAQAMGVAEAFLLNLPTETEDTSPQRFFSGPWLLEEIHELLAHLKRKSESTSPGIDGKEMTYAFIIKIPAESLKRLYDQCLEWRATPRIWLTTILVGILKRAKSSHDPNSYRIIALECCLMKGLTFLCESRCRRWAEAMKLIPISQYGFQSGRRTNSTAFILRTVAEWAASSRMNLYVAFIDLQNAFPSVNRSILWKKLADLGAAGPVMDLMRFIYDRMEYVVQLGWDRSESFSSDIGILAGDPLSPLLYILFARDCSFPRQSVDPLLGCHRVPSLHFADDICLLSLSLIGLQTNIKVLESWCSDNALIISGAKSYAMVMQAPGAPRIDLSNLHLTIAGERARFVENATYVGVTFSNNISRMFHTHSVRKAKRASSLAHSVMSTSHQLGEIPPSFAFKQYMARVDPHMTHGADVVIDLASKDIEHLERIQVNFLRRVLQVNSRSFKAMLFAETGLMPIRERRLLLSLQALRFYIDDPGVLVSAALQISVDLAKRKFPSWFSDLRRALSGLSHDLDSLLSSDNVGWLLSSDSISLVDDLVRQATVHRIHYEVSRCTRVPLLHPSSRRFLDGSNKRSHEGAAGMHEPSGYLFSLKAPKSRIALMHLRLAEHGLRCETSRRSKKGEVPAPVKECRLCGHERESEIHALFLCKGDPSLGDIRNRIEQVRASEFPSLPSVVDAQNEEAACVVLDTWLRSSSAHSFWPVIALGVRQVLELFNCNAS